MFCKPKSDEAAATIRFQAPVGKTIYNAKLKDAIGAKMAPIGRECREIASSRRHEL